MAGSQLSIPVDNLIASNLIVCNSIAYNLESFTCGFCEFALVHMSSDGLGIHNTRSSDVQGHHPQSPIRDFSGLQPHVEKILHCVWEESTFGFFCLFLLFFFLVLVIRIGVQTPAVEPTCSVYMLPGWVFLFVINAYLPGLQWNFSGKMNGNHSLW